ncbi:MAG: RNA 2',3'-cyclic phosphodiesterase [Emcibacteraceae bacterium]|nr:RNA 2',3'-cyclic phosphodiesterase [Emcibacteraceae bacterium]
MVIKMEPTIRTFVAISFNNDVMTSLKAQSSLMQEQFVERNIRWVPFQNYHMTQVFIGNIAVDDLDKLENIVSGAIHGVASFDVSLGEPTLFPPDNEKKGVLIASVQPNDALMTLQSKLEHAFRAAGYEFVDRPYRPHVTLARLRRAKVAEEELPKFAVKMMSLIFQVHIYETRKKNGRVINSILRTLDLEN